MKSENMVVKLFPVLLAFFAMGFVDLVGMRPITQNATLR